MFAFYSPMENMANLTCACKRSYNQSEEVLPMALLLIAGLGTQEILLILVIAVLLFGGKKLPELAKGLGEGIRNFKTSMKEEEKSEEKKETEAPKQA
jgi:sec-independent protein translocase protein TatA